jgi:uncharacterized RDD family membrane protein YckC
MGEFDPNRSYQQPQASSSPPVPDGGQHFGGLATPSPQPLIGALPPAGLGRRGVARIADVVLVNIIVLGINLAYGVTTYMSAPHGYGVADDFDTTSYALIGGLSSGLVMFGYFVVCEIVWGRTLAKKFLGLSVHGPAGAPKPNLKQSAIRNSFMLLSIFPYIGWLLGAAAWIIIAMTIQRSPTKQGKHDELAGGTKVVTT